MASEPVVVALIAALGGTIIGPILNSFLGNRMAARKEKADLDATIAKTAIDDGAKMRQELWARNRELEAQVQTLLLGFKNATLEQLERFESADERHRKKIEELEADAQRLEDELDLARRELASRPPSVISG